MRISVKSIAITLAALGLLASGMRLARAEAIPLQTDHDVYTLPVQINGKTSLVFILDTAASVVVLPEDLFQRLTRAGTIRAEEVRGTSTSTLANGSQMKGRSLVLDSLRVGSTVIANVIADVAPAGSPPLLGQSFLRRLPGWSIDNSHGALLIEPARWGSVTASPAPVR